jgi:very-short-patch-repair endonuclease
VAGPRRRGRLDGVRIRETTTLRPDDVRERSGLAVTTEPRTIGDLGDVLTPHQLANVIHEAGHWHRPPRAAIEDVIAAMGTRRAVTVARRALVLIDDGSAGTRSFLEDAFLDWLGRNDRMEPWVNRHVALVDGSLEVDFHWPGSGLCVEVDGSGHARTRTQVEDRARVERMLRSGLEVIRLTAAEVRAPSRALLLRIPRRRPRNS